MTFTDPILGEMRNLFITPDPKRFPVPSGVLQSNVIIWAEFQLHPEKFILADRIGAFLITPSLDAYDICGVLKHHNYIGQLDFFSANVPCPSRIEKELRRAFPCLNIAVTVCFAFATAYEDCITFAAL